MMHFVSLCKKIKDIVDPEIIEIVKRRLKRINTDAIFKSGYIEEFIEDAPLSIFPTVGNTEKPDIAAAKLLEGRVAIICEGTPIVLTVYVVQHTAPVIYWTKIDFIYIPRLHCF